MERELTSDPVLEEIWAIRERLGQRFAQHRPHGRRGECVADRRRWR